MAELLFKNPQDYLQFEFDLRCARRPAYSMRAMARDLGISPSSLNDFMKGRVGMSKSRILSIANKLQWPAVRTEHFTDLIVVKFEPNPVLRQISMLRVKGRLKEGSSGLSVDAFKAVSDWYHLVLLEICVVNKGLKEGAHLSPVAKQLDLPMPTIKAGLRRLERLGLIQATPEGFKPIDELSYLGDDQPSDAVINFHSQIVDLARKILFERFSNERNSQSIVYSVNKKDIETMNMELKSAVFSIINRYAQEKDLDSVQVFSMHSFSIYQKDSEI